MALVDVDHSSKINTIGFLQMFFFARLRNNIENVNSHTFERSQVTFRPICLLSVTSCRGEAKIFAKITKSKITRLILVSLILQIP